AALEDETVQQNEIRLAVEQGSPPFADGAPVAIAGDRLGIERNAFQDHRADDVGQIDFAIPLGRVRRQAVEEFEELRGRREKVSADVERVGDDDLFANVRNQA